MGVQKQLIESLELDEIKGMYEFLNVDYPDWFDDDKVMLFDYLVDYHGYTAVGEAMDANNIVFRRV